MELGKAPLVGLPSTAGTERGQEEEAPVRLGGSRRKAATHVVPLGLEFLLLKASVLPEVSQVGQGLPDDQEEDTNQHDAYHGAPYDGSHFGAFHTL